MPKKAKELSASEVRRLENPGNHAVGGVSGLLLQITKTGARSWILRTMVAGKRKDIGLGGFPDVTLSQARDKAREVKGQIRQGIDPVAERKAADDRLRAAAAKRVSFDECAAQFLKIKSKEFKNPKHAAQWESTLRDYASPVIGELSVDSLEIGHIKQVLTPIWEIRTETASRLRGRIESVLGYATVSGYRKGDNPARWKGNLDAVLPKPGRIRKVKHHTALPWQEVPGFMGDLKKRQGMGARALEFAILTAARSGEVRNATWDEIDLQGKLWTVPAERMKAGKAHRVPLSDDALSLLENLPRVKDSEYVFTAPRGGALSDMSLSAVCKRMEVGAVPHGFRSSFKDWARSSSAYSDEVSELALAHVNSDATRAAYARDELLPQRARLMSDWAKFCRRVRSVGEVVPLKGAKH